MLVADILSDSAAVRPDQPAVWFDGAWKTYAELDRSSNRVARFLRDLGVRAGERVAVLLENSPDYVIVHFGVHKAGAVEVSLNGDLKGGELQRLLEHCDANVVVTSGQAAARWEDELSSVSCLRHVVINSLAPGNLLRIPEAMVRTLSDCQGCPDTRPDRPTRIDIDIASIVYTSGVTGEPKGVMLSHLNLVSNSRSIAQYLGLVPNDRVLVVLPFHYIYGRSLLYSHFLTGGSVVLDNRFAFPATILETMRRQAVTCFAGVPSTFAILLRKASVRQSSFPHLRMITQAGGGMAPALQREVAEAFAPARLYVMYGCTEAAPRLTYVEPEMLARKWGAIGRAVPNVEVIVADEHGTPLPPRAIGEVAARGSNIMLGYWKDPEGTAKVLRGGWYFTGDLGYADEDGYIFLTGRSREMIKTGGYRVSAREVEDALLGIAGISEVAVVAVPDVILGEAIVAYLVPSDPAVDERRLRRELSSVIPLYKVPKYFEFRDVLPKNSSGKVLKSQLGVRGDCGSARTALTTT